MFGYSLQDAFFLKIWSSAKLKTFQMSYKFLIKVVISLFFLIGVSLKIDFASLLKALLSIDLKYYLISLLIPIANNIVLAQKYKIAMKPSGVHQPLSNLIKINFICHFYSMFLSSAIGQSVVRWHMSTKNQEGRTKFIAVMFFERSTFFFILLLALTVTLKISANQITDKIFDTVYPFLLTGMSCLIIFYSYLNFTFFFNFAKRVLIIIKKKNAFIILTKLNSFINSFSIFEGKLNILTSTLFLSIVWHLFFLFRVYLLVLSLAIPLDFINISWMASFVLFFQILPISFNGIGVREAAYTFLFGFFNISPDKGVLIGLLLFSQILFISIVGGLFHLSSKE